MDTDRQYFDHPRLKTMKKTEQSERLASPSNTEMPSHPLTNIGETYECQKDPSSAVIDR